MENKETLEELVDRLPNKKAKELGIFLQGAKWQQEQNKQEVQDLKNKLDIVRESSTKILKIVEDLEEQDKSKYSEEEVKELLSKFHILTDGTKKFEEEWFEQFKKK